MADEPVVSYTVSELLKQIDGKIERLFSMLSGKADKSELDNLSHIVRRHDTELRDLMGAQASSVMRARERTEWRKWIIPVVLSITTVVVMVIQAWKR